MTKAPGFNVKVSVTPNPVQAGQTIHLSATYTPQQSISNIVAVFWISSSYVITTFTSPPLNFIANQPLTVSFDWNIPPDQANGMYTLNPSLYETNGNAVFWTNGYPFKVANSNSDNNNDNDNDNNNSTTAQCGVANGVATETMPTVGLCTVGTASGVIDTGQGEWAWSCTGSDGSVASCGAVNSGAGPGICGLTNGTSIPDQPNKNLCASGSAGAVTGSGPWFWTCVGQQQYAGRNASCQANLCQACSGSVTSTVTGTLSIGSMAANGCTVKAVPSWTETDIYATSGKSTKLQWNDPMYGTFMQLLAEAGASATYCPPCYRSAQSVSNARVTVQGVAGTCPSDNAINSGQPVTYNATNVTLTPQ